MAWLLDVRDLDVEYQRERGARQILRGVSLGVAAGESVGVVGESGSGKSVLARAILGLLQPPWRIRRGSVLFQGQDLLRKSERDLGRIRGREIALTTPEPRKHLNPVLPVGDQIANAVQAHSGLSRRDALARAVELMKAVGIPDPGLRLRSYPHELSGGMCQRVIIAMGLAHSPKLLLADEPTAGLDVTISRQILDLMLELVETSRSSLLLVSRDLGVVAHYCQRVAVMYAGQIVEVADVPTFFAAPRHPYGRHLLRAAAAARDERRAVGTSVGVRAEPSGAACAYAARCPIAIERCRTEMPALDSVGEGHLVRCFRASDVAAQTVGA